MRAGGSSDPSQVRLLEKPMPAVPSAGGKKTDPPLLLLAERLFLFFSPCRWMRQQIQKLAGSKLGNFRASLNCVCLLSRAGYF